MDWGAASTQRVNDFNFLDEFFLNSCECEALYKEKMNKYHDQKIEKQDFLVGDLVILLNSKFFLFLGSLTF